MERGLPTGVHIVATRHARPGRRLAPYLLLAPGGLWLLMFFLVPILFMVSVSLQTGNIYDGFRQTWHVANFAEAISRYHVQFVRSIEYGAVATLAALLVAFPLAYWIAFRGGRHKTTWLLLFLLPFFVSFVIRTLAWRWILSDDGIALGTLKDLHLLPEGFHVLATPVAVISGIAYNFLPFMALPIYVALERIDRRVVEAAHDLYASHTQVFLRVTLPLAVPGLFAGVLLTFVPAVGDYVNAAILGGARTTMIGNIIQLQFLQNYDYPLAAALSFILMATLLVGILIYARLLGTRAMEEPL